MKFVFALLVLASTASAEPLKSADIAKLEKRTVELLSNITVKGQESLLLAEALQNAAAVYNDAIAKAAEEKEIAQIVGDAAKDDEAK